MRLQIARNNGSSNYQHVVDLAGMEPYDSIADPNRKKETEDINMSVSA